MKIIDDKGRLFGKINIVDFLILVCVAVLIPAFIGTYKILQKKPERVPSRWIRVEAVTFVIPEFLGLMKEGDVGYDDNGKQDSELLRITRKNEDYVGKLIKQFSGFTSDEEGGIRYRIPVFLELKLLCTRSAKNEPYYYKENHILASLDKADSFSFWTDKYKLTCYPIRIYEEAEE